MFTVYRESKTGFEKLKKIDITYIWDSKIQKIPNRPMWYIGHKKKIAILLKDFWCTS